MNKIIIKEVISKEDFEEFIKFPLSLYIGNKQYVPELDDDVRNNLNPIKNYGLSFSNVQAFIAIEKDNVVGRIVGLINEKANAKWNTKVVRFGYIDFVDNMDVSKALLDAVAKWGGEKGMKEIQGPLGITDFDKEGMLVDDFDLPGSMIDIYNHPYYPKHMEKHGFSKKVDWVQFRMKIPKEVPARYSRVAKVCKELYGLKVKKISLKEAIEREGYRVFELFNQAYEPLFGFSSLSKGQIDYFLKTYLPLADMDLIPIIENGQGEIVGAAVTMGSLS